ncbi:MAG: uroporphyrinogen decarboxylase family protein [Planctomycetota bacterium]|jgi:hypothetical protein
MKPDNLADTLARCLEDLEQRIDPDQEGRLLGDWIDFCRGRCPDEVFSPRRARSAPPCVEWPAISVNAAIDDYDAMALQQFGECSRRLAGDGGLLLNVRCNYGTGIMPSLFGAEPFVMDERLNTLPTARPLGSGEAMRKLLDGGMPELTSGLGARTLEMGERFAEIAGAHPKIGRFVHVYHPDLQGPMDVVELLWGSSFFYALHDEPALVRELLEMATATYIAFMRAWERVVPFRDGCQAHWGFLHEGRIMLRDDSAMNLSPEMYEEFIRPYDQELLDEFRGGAIHFCGRGDHFIESISQVRGLKAVHMSQPGWNDMEVILRHTAEKGIKLLGLKTEAAEAARRAGLPLRGQVHCGEPSAAGWTAPAP